MQRFKTTATAITFLFLTSSLFAQVVNVGSGSYTKTFPGTDEAGRNGFPSGTPNSIGIAASKPVPTNDWWSHIVKNNHSSNLFNYPFALKTVNQGLVVSYIPWGVFDDIVPITVGVTGLNASKANVSDFSDWTVTMDWQSTNHHLKAITGIGMPFIYFTKDSTDEAKITITQGTVTVTDEMLLIEDARNGGDFAVYAPIGSTWSKNGMDYTSSLNGKNYWSLGFIPLDATSLSATANEYKKYAYVFPKNTTTSYSYDENTSIVTTDFNVEVEIMEGADTIPLLGLLPHHWANLKSGSPNFTSHTYETVRGKMKTMETKEFTVQNTFHGILPTLPYLDHYSKGFSPSKMSEKVKLLENDPLATWTDSYNEGQVMNRLVQTARIAELSGDTVALNKMLATVKERLEDWLKVQTNEKAFLFYYNETWSAMLGYPSGHGQDNNINDHHFHWGYFIHAASFLEQYEPGWAAKWGEMIHLLIEDAASTNRNDTLFPFLRNFSPYAGHSWANGFATFPQGNDQESTSESMQFNSSLIHWGSVTGNDSIKNLGIYLYTTEQSAIEEYWFDQNERNFKSTQQYSLVSRVWGNSYDNGTFWTADIAASYGIEMYPIHGGSLYLGHDTTYSKKLWKEIEQNTGILKNEANDNLWHDIMWQYLSFTDPEKAIDLYDSYSDRNLKFGVTDALTYHWLHSMNALGNVDASITANHAVAAAFNKAGVITYVAQNYGTDSITVTYSTGFKLSVPPKTLATSRDLDVNGSLTSSFSEAYLGGSVDLELIVTEGNPSKIEFYNGVDLIGSKTQMPYSITVENLTAGKQYFYARIYEGTKFEISNLVPVTVGEQLPYSFEPIAIPGSFSAAHYDVFEGGNGNGIAYQDITVGNEGNFRTEEYVDAEKSGSQGSIVTNISSNEWLEYTVDVKQAGNYNLSFKYASGNTSGGGPFKIESDEIEVKNDIKVNYSGAWDAWTTKTVNNVPLKSGVQVLRFTFNEGELNLGRLTFTYVAGLTYSQPVAKAGENEIVVLPSNSIQLDGTGSSEPSNQTLIYEWTQVYGPSTLQFSDNTLAEPIVKTLKEGIYKIRLKVDNGTYSDVDEVYIISSNTNNVAPKVSISSPSNNSKFVESESLSISAFASDLNDRVTKVDLWINDILIGSAQEPYNWPWEPDSGKYKLVAIAYDSFGDSTISSTINVSVDPAPSCEGTSWNGDFKYLFSDDDNNPTITFIPTHSATGSPTCILYYGTDPGAMGGQGVKPNVPFRISASEGSKIYFYYTYSFQGGLENNNSGNKDTYVIGSCEEEPTNVKNISTDFELEYYPNPVRDFLHIELKQGISNISVFNSMGQQMQERQVKNTNFNLDMSTYASGLYWVNVFRNGQLKRILISKM